MVTEVVTAHDLWVSEWVCKHKIVGNAVQVTGLVSQRRAPALRVVVIQKGHTQTGGQPAALRDPPTAAAAAAQLCYVPLLEGATHVVSKAELGHEAVVRVHSRLHRLALAEDDLLKDPRAANLGQVLPDLMQDRPREKGGGERKGEMVDDEATDGKLAVGGSVCV